MHNWLSSHDLNTLQDLPTGCLLHMRVLLTSIKGRTSTTGEKLSFFATYDACAWLFFAKKEPCIAHPVMFSRSCGVKRHMQKLAWRSAPSHVRWVTWVCAGIEWMWRTLAACMLHLRLKDMYTLCMYRQASQWEWGGDYLGKCKISQKKECTSIFYMLLQYRIQLRLSAFSRFERTYVSPAQELVCRYKETRSFNFAMRLKSDS